MGDRVLLGRLHFGGRELFAGVDRTLRLIVRHKQRIVAETVGAARGTQQHARHFADFDGFAGDHVRLIIIRTVRLAPSRHDQRGGAAEPCGALAVGDVGQLLEQQRVVGLVVAVLAGPACGQDARRVAHDVHDQAGIVRDCRAAGAFGHVARLDERVLLEGHAVLDRIGQSQGACGDELDVGGVRAETFLENAADFRQFAFVMRGDDDLHALRFLPSFSYLYLFCVVLCAESPASDRQRPTFSACRAVDRLSRARARRVGRPAAPCCPFRRGRAGC